MLFQSTERVWPGGRPPPASGQPRFMKERKPIFYDAEKVRWRRTRRILEISGGLLTLLLIYFFLTIAGSVELPAALLPDTRPIYHSLKKEPFKPVALRGGGHKR